MPRILLVECMQEISSFNPLRSGYQDFAVQRGSEMLRQRGSNTAVGGMLEVLEATAGVSIVPAYGAQAPSAGPLSSEGWRTLSGQLLDAVRANCDGVDGVLVSLHGAMGADGELDPEGALLTEIRQIVGPSVKIVMSLDLHGIATGRMLEQVDAVAVYHTYPHNDFADTGARRRARCCGCSGNRCDR
jgi:microcystin degradation protein MlrC